MSHIVLSELACKVKVVPLGTMKALVVGGVSCEWPAPYPSI